MNKRASVLLTALVMLGLFSTAANADVKKGQKVYLKKCKKCHGNGTKGAAMKTQAEWDAAFKDNAKIFRDWHKNDQNAMKYIDSSKFEKDAPSLRDFLYFYGSDSGNVPACG